MPPPARRSRALRSSAPRRWAPRAYAGSWATSRSGSASARASSSSEGGGTGLPGGPLLLAQGPAEAAQIGGVHAGEGRGEQGQGGLGVEPATAVGCRAAAAAALGPGLAPLVGTGLAPARSGRDAVRPCSHGRARGPPPPVATGAQAPSGAGPPPVRGAGAGRRRRCPGERPAAVRARRTVGDRAAAGAHQDGHLAPGNTVLQVGAAQDVGDVVQLRAGRRVRVDLDAAAVADRGAVRGGRGPSRPGRRVSGMRWVSRRVAASRAAPERREVLRTSTGAGRPSARGKASGKSRMPFTSAPRNA